MSLCYREQRQLCGIEVGLFRSDSHLAGMLAAPLQPGAYSARPGARPPAARPGRVPDQPRLLPHPDQPGLRPGLSAPFGFAAAACLIAALTSLLRGGRYVYGE